MPIPPIRARPCSATFARPLVRGVAASHATFVAELRQLLVGKASLAGVSISDVRTVDAGRAAFITGKGGVTVDWSRGSA